jgi:hypothetical protein
MSQPNQGHVNNRTKTVVSAVVAFAAGGLTSSMLAISPLLKASVVGLMTAAVFIGMQMMLIRRNGGGQNS